MLICQAEDKHRLRFSDLHTAIFIDCGNYVVTQQVVEILEGKRERYPLWKETNLT